MNIAPPGVCACSAYAGVVFTAFLQGRRTSPACFFPLLLLLPPPPPAPSFFVSLAASMLPSPRVRINSYNYITRWRDHYSWQTFLFSPFSFSIPPSCFLFQKTTTKSSFPRGRLTLVVRIARGGISKGSLRARSTTNGCCRAITICHDTSTRPLVLRLLIGGKDF